MPEDNDNQAPKPQNPEPVYSGEDIPGKDEIVVPEEIPQEHLALASMTGDIEKAPKKVIFKRFLLLLLGLAVLAAIGVAAWKLIPAKDQNQQAPQANQVQTPQDQQNADPVALALGDTNLTQDYTNDTLRLSLKRPDSWKVSEEGNAVIVKSPSFDMDDNTGMSDSTFFKIYIKMGAGESEGKYLGKGYAVAPSEKINYTDPEVGQRKTTYLTDFGIDNTDNFAYFVVQGNFNLEKGDTLGPKFASEPDAFLVSGGFATEADKDGLQTRLVSLDGYKQNLAYQTAIEIVKSLQLK